MCAVRLRFGGLRSGKQPNGRLLRTAEVEPDHNGRSETR